jgi:hypothetical protein
MLCLPRATVAAVKGFAHARPGGSVADSIIKSASDLGGARRGVRVLLKGASGDAGDIDITVSPNVEDNLWCYRKECYKGVAKVLQGYVNITIDPHVQYNR